MAVPNLSDLYQISSIIGSTTSDSNNTISFTTGDVVNGETSAPKVQAWQQVGFASRPAEAIPGKSSAESINLVRANGDLSIASRDLRDQKIYGTLGAGETIIYSTGVAGEGQARISLKGDGSITLYTTTDSPDGGIRNTDTGVGLYLKLDPDKLSFVAPWGRLIFDRSGLHIKTGTGAAIDLSNVNIPAPGGNSCNISANTIILNGNAVCLGPSDLGYMGAVFGILPPSVPFVPILGVGVGAITVSASASTCVFISPGNL